MPDNKGIATLWPRDIPTAREVQEILRGRVKIMPLKKPPAYIAAVDASFLDKTIIAVACLYTYPDLILLQDVWIEEESRFPYVPGFLSFREGHAVINALKRLKISPDLILVDGQGIAHPRGIGIASHLGVLLEKPTIGCAKSRLVGEFDEPGLKKGSWEYLSYQGARVGAVLRTRDHTKPLFVSPGHRVDIPSSVEVIMKCIFRYRIPEPLRRTDLISKRMKRECR
jgi:deoxyribonuclease V